MIDLYSYYGGLFVTIFVILILKYIYGESIELGKKKWILIVISYLAIDFIIRRLWSGYGGVELAFIIPSTVIFLSRKRKRIRGMFLVFPAIFTGMIPYCIASLLLIVISNKELSVISSNIYFSILADALTIIALVYIIRARKGFKDYFILNTWDKLIIMCSSVLVVTSLLGLNEMRINKILGDYEIGASIFVLVAMIILVISTVIAITKNKSINYYKSIVKINEHYMEAQLRHFEAYKLSQRETRKIKHDMKNHMLCIYELCKRKKYDNLSQYIDNLGEIIINTDTDLCSGNDIVDAIINEKNTIANKNGININIDGDFGIIGKLAPVDTVIIISNAIDNAIEFCSKLPDKIDKYINISVKRDRNYMIIIFTNPADKELLIKDNTIRSNKGDNLNHGFGLENMKNVIGKYNGELLISCDEIIPKKLYEFKLEMILLI